MASVQHFFSDAHFLPNEIINKCSQSEEKEKDIHFAAVRIQRCLRGYNVRKVIKKWHKAATTIQRYVRGFLVRWHLPELYAKNLEVKYCSYYNRMATKIQALWRGYCYRKREDTVNVKKAISERLAIEARNTEVQNQLHEMMEKVREEVPKNPEEEDCKKEVIFLLYKLHHLLRTRQTQGIYSLHGTTQLSALEILMKALPFTDYMKELRKVYNRESQNQTRQYHFTSKKMQKMEDLYQKRDKDLEASNEAAAVQKRTDYSFSKEKLEKKPYERMITTQGPYPPPKFIFRQRVPEKEIQNKKKAKPYHPYHIDFWTKSCPIHNPPSYFD